MDNFDNRFAYFDFGNVSGSVKLVPASELSSLTPEQIKSLPAGRRIELIQNYYHNTLLNNSSYCY
jgi:hypothetical protein